MTQSSLLENSLHNQSFDFDYIVYIGRFQPFHLAHLKVVEMALQQSKYVLLVLGSAQNERSLKNPFTVNERKEMILANFSAEIQKRIIFVPIIDVYNDEKWVKLVKEQVNFAINTNQADLNHNAKIALIGHFKDDSSYYLRLFPEWQLINIENLYQQLSATPIRQKYYQGQIDNEHLSKPVQDFLKQFQNKLVYQMLKDYAQREDNSVIVKEEQKNELG
ncbi:MULTISPECIES: nicotinate-nicotinamide nucleotide adenylyltransferase [unclassified Acinetobacter]|uniref:nicotinate-nicotinamide nucleotide adenylyltransferase n=1 Tax=unclassified Acinetobacter TaxID=196816 RepID=UPI0035B7FCEB